MKRNIKMLVIAVLVLAIIGGLYFFAMKWQPEEDNAQEENPFDLGNTEYLLDVETEDIDYAQFNNGEETYIIRNGEIPSIEGYFSNVIDENALSSALSSCAKVAISHKIENTQDLAVYGLDKEEKYLLIKTKDGAEHKIVLGNSANFEGEFYAMNKATGKVATIASYEAEMIVKSPSEYRSLKLFEIDSTQITAVTIEKNGKKELSLKVDEDYVPENEYMTASYIMSYPYKDVTVSLDRLQVLFESITSPVAKSIVEENPKNLAKYGFDKPYVLILTDTQKETVTIKMGSYDSDGNIYMMYNNVPVVYAAECSFYEEVKGTRGSEYVERFINLFNIADITNITIKSNEKTYELEVDEKEENSQYKIDGKFVAEDNFKKLYQQIIGITAAEFTQKTAKGEKKCSITFTFKDKSKKTFDYYTYDERYCIVNAANGMNCLTLTKNIDMMLESLK